jgi:hypothetical protein
LTNFNLDLSTIFLGINTVGRLYGKLADAVQNVARFIQVPFGSLDKRNGVLDVRASLVQTPYLGAQFFGNRQSRGIVSATVNTLARGKTLDVLLYFSSAIRQDPARLRRAHGVVKDHITPP